MAPYSEAMFYLTIFLQNAQVLGARLFRGIVFLSGTPNRSCSLMQTSKTMLFDSMVIT